MIDLTRAADSSVDIHSALTEDLLRGGAGALLGRAALAFCSQDLVSCGALPQVDFDFSADGAHQGHQPDKYDYISVLQNPRASQEDKLRAVEHLAQLGVEKVTLLMPNGELVECRIDVSPVSEGSDRNYVHLYAQTKDGREIIALRAISENGRLEKEQTDGKPVPYQGSEWSKNLYWIGPDQYPVAKQADKRPDGQYPPENQAEAPSEDEAKAAKAKASEQSGEQAVTGPSGSGPQHEPLVHHRDDERVPYEHRNPGPEKEDGYPD